MTQASSLLNCEGDFHAANYTQVRKTKTNLLPSCSQHPIQVKDVCVLVALRSAKMVAMALDGLLTHCGWKENTLRELAARRAAGECLTGLELCWFDMSRECVCERERLSE